MKPQSAAEQKISIHDIRGPLLKTAKRKGRGRPPKEQGSAGAPKQRRNWTRKTHAYVKVVTEGKGAPCKIWTLREKKMLLQGLRKYSHQDWDSLCKLIPTRSKQEIQEYIHTLRGGEFNKNKPKEDAHLTWAPIESWLDMSSEMVHYEQIDLSNILGRVFSMIGHFANFPQTSDNSAELVPDYGKLYRYIAAVMDESLTMPELSPLEAAIVADLMHALGDSLRMSDTSLQRKVMCWKYKMLNYKFEYDDVRGSLDRIRKALTNDFSDLQRDSNRGVSGLPSFTQRPASTTRETSLGISDSQPGGSSPFISHTQTAASNTHNSSVVHGETSSAIVSQSASPSGASASDSPQKAGDQNGGQPKRKRGRPRLHHWRRPIDKPRLFTMNPFCVPIRLLQLKSLLAKAAADRASHAGTATRQPAGVSSTPSVSSEASGQTLTQKDLSIQMESTKAEVTNDLRQVTGLYVPKIVKTYKKKDSENQVSSNVRRAISEALAKRSKQRQTAAAGEASFMPRAAGPEILQPADQANPLPSQTFRYVDLHDGNVALVPLHLKDPAALSQVHMKQAMPVPKRLPTLAPHPTVQNSPQRSDAVASKSSTAPSIHAPKTSSSIFVDTLLPAKERAHSTQSSVFAHTSASTGNLPSLEAASFQVNPGQQTYNSVGRQAVTAQQSVTMPGQSDGGPVLHTVETGPVMLASPKLPVLVSSAQGMIVQQSKKAEGIDTQAKREAHKPAILRASKTVQLSEPAVYSSGPIIVHPDQDATAVQVAQIIPRKRYRSKSNADNARVITTEIRVPLPPTCIIDPKPVAHAAKKSSTSKSILKKQTKAPGSKTDKTSSPERKAKILKSKRSKSKTDSVTSKSKKSVQSPKVVKKKSCNPKRRKDLSVQSANPATVFQFSGLSDNGDSVTAHKTNPHQAKTYTRVPCATVMESSPVQGAVMRQSPLVVATVLPQSSQPQTGGQKTQSSIAMDGGPLQLITLQKSVSSHLSSGSQSHQTPSHTAVSATCLVPSEGNTRDKPLFRTILAQVASSQLAASPATTDGNQRVPPSPSPSSSSLPRSSPYKRQRLTKNFPGMEKSKLQSQLLMSGAVMKTEEASKIGQGKPRELVKINQWRTPPAQLDRKRGVKHVHFAKKRPSNFLAHEDISTMQVEIVTPEDARGRLSASLQKDRIQKRIGDYQRPANSEALDVVVENDEFSLVSI